MAAQRVLNPLSLAGSEVPLGFSEGQRVGRSTLWVASREAPLAQRVPSEEAAGGLSWVRGGGVDAAPQSHMIL